MATRISSDRRGMRKSPRQQRSQATVAAIVEAAARILAARGWAEFTTNEVATVAGVSIGSLYQYFPNKLALADAIRRRHLDAVLAALGEDKDTALPKRIARLIDGVIAAHTVNQRLHHVLLDEVPLAARSDQDPFEVEYLKRYQAFARTELRARILASAVEGVVHAAARRGELDSPGVKAELNRLVAGYIG